jgi:ribonuclease HI
MRFITVHQRPIFAKTRNYGNDEILEMKERVEDLLKAGVIEPTRSGYAATSRIVPKKSGPGRLVVNYIPLNRVTLRDSYCLPQVSDILSVIPGMEFFTTMDCAQGFYQILVDARDRHKTAFSTPVGNFQYVRCPFGARNSCAVFQAEMNRIFADGLYTRCAIYVDDILIFGRDREEHDANLLWVLERAKGSNVKIKLEKCHFAQAEVDYLGYRISGSSIKPLPIKVEDLCRSKHPRDKTELRSLIGRLLFCARFIPRFSQQLEPLRELYRQNSDYQWKERHQKALDGIIKSLEKACAQKMVPNYTNKVIELHILQDSLEVLCLTEDDQLICRSSRFLSAAEVNYSAVEKQLLALVLAISKFRYHLQPDKFVVRVPTNGLAKALNLVERPERVDNLLLKMPAGFDNFNFDVKPSLVATINKTSEEHLPQEVYYVDGACKRNGKPDCVASWAVCAEFDQDLKATGFVTESPSNNSAELTAAIRACEIAKELGQTEITIITDSKYLHSAVTVWIDKWNTNDFLDCKKKQVVNTKLFKELTAAKHGLKIEWIHVRGHADTPGNIKADLLARSLLDADSAAICSMSIGNHDIQDGNEEVERLKLQINGGKAPGFVIEDNCVYRIDPKVESGDPKQIYVPKSSIPYLLNLAHDNQIYGGHLGIKKTFAKLSKFWWPGKHKDVESYVKSCELCQIFKRQHGLPYGHLHSIPVSFVFENMHIDMIGPVTTTTNGNKYIITATDAFSKWAFARPLKNITTTEVIRFIEEAIVSIHGEPKNIITDRGVQFRSKQWENYVKKTTGINHNKTSGYHPQANGLDERFNGTLVRILLSYVNENQEDWDDHVKWAVYLYNTTVHDSTGFTPYHVMFGLTPRSPLNVHPIVENIDPAKLDELRENIRESTAEQIKRAQTKQAEDYNKRHNKVALQIGQLVWVKEHTCPSDLSKKMFPKYYGPCVIVGIMGENTNPRAVAIFDPVLLKKKTVSLQDLKQFEERPDHLVSREGPSERKDEAQDTSSCTEDLIDLYSPEYYCSTGDVPDQLIEHNVTIMDAPCSPTEHFEATSLEPSSVETFEPISRPSNYFQSPLTSSPRRVTLNDEVQIHFFNREASTAGKEQNETSNFNQEASEEVTIVTEPQESVTQDKVDQSNSSTTGGSLQDPSLLNVSTPQHSRISPYRMEIIVDDSTKDPTYAPRKAIPTRPQEQTGPSSSRSQSSTVTQSQERAAGTVSGPTISQPVGYNLTRKTPISWLRFAQQLTLLRVKLFEGSLMAQFVHPFYAN